MEAAYRSRETSKPCSARVGSQRRSNGKRRRRMRRSSHSAVSKTAIGRCQRERAAMPLAGRSWRRPPGRARTQAHAGTQSCLKPLPQSPATPCSLIHVLDSHDREYCCARSALSTPASEARSKGWLGWPVRSRAENGPCSRSIPRKMGSSLGV